MPDIQTLIARQLEAWEGRDPALLAQGYAEDAVVSSPMFPRAEGRTAIELSFAAIFRVFPDWTMVGEPPCVSGNRVMQLCKCGGTQQGDFMGVPGTGRRTEFDCVLIFDVEDGLIKREKRIYDFTGMLIQLGVLRGKPAV
jgi:steroid delta-isomerase-like uncharacterized protein